MRQDLNIHLHDSDQIRCEHQLNERQPEGYPVLILEGPRGNLVIFPGWDRLKRLRDVISACLAVHTPDDLTDELMTIAEEFMQGMAKPVPAEACTDWDDPAHVNCDHLGGDCVVERRRAAVDVDELIGSMAESYEVRRDIP